MRRCAQCAASARHTVRAQQPGSKVARSHVDGARVSLFRGSRNKAPEGMGGCCPGAPQGCAGVGWGSPGGDSGADSGPSEDQSGLTLTKQAHSWLNPCQPVSSQGAAAAGASHTCSSDETLPPGGSQSQQLPVGPRVRPPCPSPRRGPAPATVWAPCGACSGAMAGPPPPRAPLSCCAPSVLSLLPLCSSLSSVPAPYVLAHTGRLY